MLTNERQWFSGCVAIVHVLQIYSCLVHSDIVQEFWNYLCQSFVIVFCSFFKVKPMYAIQFFFFFLSNRAGKYRAWLQKNSQHLFCHCTKCWKTWRYSWENRRYSCWVHEDVTGEVSETRPCINYQKRAHFQSSFWVLSIIHCLSITTLKYGSSVPPAHVITTTECIQMHG